MLHFLNAGYTVDNNRVVLWQRGNYLYEIDIRGGKKVTVQDSFEVALEKFKQIAIKSIV